LGFLLWKINKFYDPFDVRQMIKRVDGADGLYDRYKVRSSDQAKKYDLK